MNTLSRQVALALLAMSGGMTAHAQVVVSQVYGGAGCGTAGCSTYRNDYIELFNRGTTSLNVNGWSVQYASATGTAWQVTALPNVSIPAGGYLLVAQGAGPNGVSAIPTPDATGTVAMSGTAGKVALVNSVTALSGACPVSGSFVDLVGYGATASCNEGGTNAPAPSTTLADFRAAAGCTDTNNNGSDFATATPAARNSSTTLAPCAGPGTPQLSIGDVSVVEGDDGTSSAIFTISLDQPAGPGGVRFDFATADNTATLADNDYAASSGFATIFQGTTSTIIGVDVLGDTTREANETYLVNITNIVGATALDSQAVGTISNDDVVVIPIHDVQGPGGSSPIVGSSVDIEGIVTGKKSNGFFVQTPDAEIDADPATSQGLFVFTTNAGYLTAAAVGNRVRVSGTVVEFIPSTDPGQLPLTELSGVSGVTAVSVGNALPTPVALTPTFPSPAGPLDQLERLEGMRVSVADATVVGPTQGNTSETTAVGTSTGILHAVVTGVPRPFREPGIQAPDGVPAGSSIPPIPRWDFNPELFTVDTDGIAGAGSQLDLAAGARITNLVGPLDYGFRRYTVMRELNAATAIVTGPTVTPARVPTADEFIVGSYNLERFFDTVNDPGGDPVLTPAAYQKRLGKASAAIRDFLNLPDILGIVEIEHLSTLQDVADRVNADVVNAGGTSPQYAAYLVEGNDVGGIDVGFLIKSAPVAGTTPRVEVLQVVQVGKDTTWIDPSDNQASLLNDRPPLQVDAVVHYADGRRFPITAVVVHQRSLNGAESNAPGGLTTEGDRVRRKRQAQAEFLANHLQSLQAADPARRIVAVGDFNAFEFNDGYGDSMGTSIGRPTPDNETVVPNDGVDLVTPDFSNLADLEAPDQRYSFTFGGNAQSLDHVIANAALLSASSGTSLDHARINSDFPEVSRNTDGPARLSDHDPAIAYFTAAPLLADLSVDATAATPTVAFGQTARFDVRVTHDGANAESGQGGDPARFPGVGFALDFAAPDAQVTAPAGWTCDAPVVDANSTSAACTSTTAMTSGTTADFVVTATAPAARAGGTLNLVASTTSETRDPDTADNSDSASILVGAGADLALRLSGPSALTRNTPTATYRASLSNVGPLTSSNAVVRFAIDTPQPGTLTIAGSAGWSCRRLASATFVGECTRSTLAVGNAGYIDVRMPFLAWVRKSSLVIDASITAPNDPQVGNNRTVVEVPASL